MSKAFTKDDDAGAPLVVAPRAPLPPGVTNYVTPEGLAALRTELALLFEERNALAAELDAARATAAAGLAERIVELEARIGSAEVVAPPEDPPDVVRFGATVSVRSGGGDERAYRIVGVDEANAAEGRIAFVAPLARALLGKRVGDPALVRTPHGDEELQITGLAYARPA